MTSRRAGSISGIATRKGLCVSRTHSIPLPFPRRAFWFPSLRTISRRTALSKCPMLSCRMSERVSSELRGSLSRHGRDERLSTGRQGFAARRRSKRRYAFFALVFLILIAIGGLIWGLQQSNVRIARVEVFGADQSLADIALKAMRGTDLGLISRGFIF